MLNPAMLSSLLATLALPGAALALREGRNGPGQPLSFNSDSTFQITIIEDLHYGEAPSSYGPVQDALTSRTVSSLLAADPSTDLVVINGDIISRDNVFFANTTAYVDRAVAPIADRGLTWASVHGNHDPGLNRSVEAMVARERAHPGARTRSMVPDPQRVGATNYRIPVFPPDCPSPCAAGCAPEMLLWFLDSRSGFAYQTTGPDGARVPRPNWVDADVVAWFLAENDRLTQKYNRTIPALVFVHIPVDAFRAIRAVPGLVDPLRNPGLNDQTITGQADGVCSDGVTRNGACAYGGQDIPLMRALAATPGLLGVFSAHIHGQSWCYKWTKDTPLPGFPVTPAADGLNLCFGQRTGYGGNGDWQRGARNLLLSREGIARGELDTWIRLEDGEVVGDVSLNATFGQDMYKPSPNRKTYCEECLLMGKPRSD